MTIPEKVAVPPKYSAYLFDDETTMKNETYEGCCERLFRGSHVTDNRILTCWRKFIAIIMTRDAMFGSLKSSASSLVSWRDEDG